MSNANSQWIMREDGKDCFVVGALNAGHVSYRDGRYVAVSHCSTAFLYGHETRFFESQDDAYDWVANMWAQYEAQRTTA